MDEFEQARVQAMKNGREGAAVNATKEKKHSVRPPDRAQRDRLGRRVRPLKRRRTGTGADRAFERIRSNGRCVRRRRRDEALKHFEPPRPPHTRRQIADSL